MIQNARLNGFTKATQSNEPEQAPTPEPNTEESTLQQILKHVANIIDEINKQKKQMGAFHFPICFFFLSVFVYFGEIE